MDEGPCQANHGGAVCAAGLPASGVVRALDELGPTGPSCQFPIHLRLSAEVGRLPRRWIRTSQRSRREGLRLHGRACCLHRHERQGHWGSSKSRQSGGRECRARPRTVVVTFGLAVIAFPRHAGASVFRRPAAFAARGAALAGAPGGVSANGLGASPRAERSRGSASFIGAAPARPLVVLRPRRRRTMKSPRHGDPGPLAFPRVTRQRGGRESGRDRGARRHRAPVRPFYAR